MAQFFSELTKKRSNGEISEKSRREAATYCQGGHKVSSVADVAEWMQRKFPLEPAFNAGLVHGSYPAGIAAFFTSVEGDWSTYDQHCIYVVLGHVCRSRLTAAKDSLTKERYRDWMAGSNQHLANGLLHASLAAFSLSGGHPSPLVVERTGLAYDCPLQMARDATKHQQQAVALRSEKYAAQYAATQSEKSPSAFPSYKSSLETLALCFGAVARMATDHRENEICAKLQRQYETRAGQLALDDPAILQSASSGLLTQAQQQRVMSDIAMRNIGLALVCPTVAAPVSREMCLHCSSRPPTHAGVTCRCRCLCGACVIADTLMDCPSCGQFTEFRI